MSTRKGSATKEDLQNFKEEIVHQFHVISEGVIDQVKQVAEGVANVNEKLDRRFNELKAEIQETRQEVLVWCLNNGFTMINLLQDLLNFLGPYKRFRVIII